MSFDSDHSITNSAVPGVLVDLKQMKKPDDWRLSRYVRLLCYSIFVSGFILFTRIHEHTLFLYGWDSVQYALSIEDYDVHSHQPHPPGYLFYSFSLKILNLLFQDHNLSILSFNFAAAIFSCFFIALSIYHLSHQKLDFEREILSVLGAFLYATNPIARFYSSVAEIYAIEGLLVSVLGFLLIRALTDPRFLLYASIAMGISGGYRLTTEVFLFPFYLLVLLRNSQPRIVRSLMVLAIVNGLWLAITSIFYGGLGNYLEKIFLQFFQNASITSPFLSQSFYANRSLKIIIYRLLQAISIPVFLAILIRFRKVRWNVIPLPLFIFPVLPSLFFAFIHFPKDGYLLLIIPAVITIGVTLLLTAYKLKAACTILVLASLMNLFIFTNIFMSYKRGSIKKLSFTNQSEIEKFNRYWTEFMSATSKLSWGRRLFIVSPGAFPDWRMVMYYFPRDVAVLLPTSTVEKKVWASYAEERKSKFIHTRLVLDKNIRTVIFATDQKPPVLTNSFTVDQRTYWFARRRNLPTEFEMNSFQFLKE